MEIEQIKAIKLNFILATARTGSTLLSTMFNTHPNVISTFEEPFAYNLYPKYNKVNVWDSKIIQEFCDDFYLFSVGMLDIQFGKKKDLVTLLEKNKPYLTATIAIKIAYLCFFPAKEKNKITAILDKQLKFHLCLKEVALFYPESKFIILHRDPRDQVLTRAKMQKKREKRKNKAQSYYHLASTWKYIYGKLLRLKNQIGESRFLEIKYEDLVSNQEQELKKICTFLNIPFNSIMLNYDEQINTEFKNTTLSADVLKEFLVFHGGLRQKVNTDKINAWKQELTPEEANLIWTVCGELAEKIGYKKSEDFSKQKIKLKDYFTYLTILKARVKTSLYYAAPFFIRYLIKKVKYKARLKQAA